MTVGQVFTLAELEQACEFWGCNCGPVALAVACGVTLTEAHVALPDFDDRHYTNPSMMLQALRFLGAKFTHRWDARLPVEPWPSFGLCRIQWDGPWCRGGVPIQARYRKTHWVATATRGESRGIYDINEPRWVGFDDWARVIVPEIIKECVPGASGKWWVANAIEVHP